MVWGAIGFGMKSELIIFENGTVNSERYLEAIQNFFTQADSIYGLGNWVFVQDGAACHTSEMALEALSQKCILNPEWPPNSPDLNPIEMVWGVLKHQMDWNKVHCVQDAKDQLTHLWNSIPQASIDSLCLSFPTRVTMVHDAEGQTIQPLLSNRRTSVPADYLPDRPATPHFSPWTEEEDMLLMDLRKREPRLSWTLMAVRFPGRSRISVKNRCQTLEKMKKNRQWGMEHGNCEEI
jgi:hypothetical protein